MYYTRPIEYTCHDEDATVTFDNALSRNHFVIDGMAKWPLTLSASGRYRFDIVSGGKPSRWPTGAGGSFNSHPFRFSTEKMVPMKITQNTQTVYVTLFLRRQLIFTLR